MAFRSRLGRIEERKQKQRIFMAIVGSVGLLLFLGIFGLRILEGFSVLMDSIRPTAPVTEIESELILPPVLDPLPEATNSAMIDVTGKGTEGLTLIVYVNDSEYKKINVETGGTFAIKNIPMKEGVNSINAQLANEKNEKSTLSNTLTISIKRKGPILELNEPADGTTITGEKNIVVISGKTEENSTITINGHFVVLASDNSFRYEYPLSTGDNAISVVSVDQAGNKTTIDRLVRYER